jgi:hypothetical protein
VGGNILALAAGVSLRFCHRTLRIAIGGLQARKGNAIFITFDMALIVAIVEKELRHLRLHSKLVPTVSTALGPVLCGSALDDNSSVLRARLGVRCKTELAGTPHGHHHHDQQRDRDEDDPIRY